MSWMDSLGSAARPGKNLSPDERKKISKDLVTMSSMGAAAVTYVPVPLTDFVLVTPVQASMVMAVGRVYGRELSMKEAKDILLELATVCGLGLIAQKGFATLSKILLPGLGGLLAGPYAFAVTYGMGHAAMSYFENKDLTREMLKRVYEEAVAEGKRIFSRKKVEDFRKEKGVEVTNFAKKEAEKDQAGGEGGARAAPKAKRKAGGKKKRTSRRAATGRP
jgi:uncharacterized protein (DUF697 family)